MAELEQENSMNHSLKSLFMNTNWNPLIDGFKKCKKGTFTRFIFVANSVDFHNGGTPNRKILQQIFEAHGPLYDVFIVENKPFANIAFKNVNDAISAYFEINGKVHNLLSRKLYLDFSEPRYPKQCVDIVPDFINLSKDIPTPNGLILIEDYIDSQTEQALVKHIECDESNKWIDNFSRRVKHYGYEFDYNTLSIDTKKKIAQIPTIFQQILPHNSMEQDSFLCDEVIKYSKEIDQCTVNEYENGQGIRPHIESTECFAEYVISLSLLSPIIMDFRHRITNIKKSILLPPRSLLIIGDEARYKWSHGIAHRKFDVINGKITERQRRVSLTFRKIKIPSNGPKNILIAPHIESNHVHNVYDAIAPHFSHTRHSGWPQVVSFINSVKTEFVYPMMADVGCGNGKYLKIIQKDPNLRDCVYAIGMDFSENLCKIVAKRHCEVFVSDALLIPFMDNSFDAVLNIAVLHHISDKERRLRLLAELFRITKKNGRGFICAWALEQDGSSRHDFEKSDVFVPWNLSKKKIQKKMEDDDEDIVLQRYCHVYKKGELEELVAEIANIVVTNGKELKQRDKKYDIEIERSFYNKGNWCIEYRKH